MKLFFPIYSGVKFCNLTPKGQKCYKNAEGYFMRIPNISHFLSDMIFLIIKMIAHYEIDTLQKWGHVTYLIKGNHVHQLSRILTSALKNLMLIRR
jgi:hypothetical protein